MTLNLTGFREPGYTVNSWFDRQKIKMLTGNKPDRAGDLREINLSVIMKLLQKNAPTSRAALATLTGLNKTTVSNLVKELIEYRLVREVGLSSANIGRPSRLLEINPDAGIMVSGEIGVGFIAMMVTNSAAEVLWQETVINESPLEQALTMIRRAIREGQKSSETLLGISVSVPGLVNQHTGDVLMAPNMGWHNIPLQAVLQDTFPQTRIFVENEANVAALGEYYFGAARDYNEILFLSAGVGLGGAMVINGRVFRGRTGMAGEFGHMTMEANGKLCSCGNRGCWETLVNEQALFDHIRSAFASNRPSHIRDLSHLSVQTVLQAAHLGDELAREAFAEIGRCLGIGAASLVNALNPDLVVLGGTMSIAGEYILPALRAELSARAMHWNEAATDVVLAQYGSEASLMGGVAKVFQAILSSITTSTVYGVKESSS